MGFTEILGLLFCFYQAALTGRINIDGSCPTTGFGCLQCLSRGSSDLDRCFQLNMYISKTNTNNEEGIERYCSGDCPILLATAYHYCGNFTTISALFDECPGYSVMPRGSFNVQVNYSRQHCLDSRSLSKSKCSHCLGEGDRNAMRCLQFYLLAIYANSTASNYIESYCNSNCPITTWTSTSYCTTSGSTLEYTYQICRKFGASYCLQIEQQSPIEFNSAVSSCRSGCTSTACEASRAKFGCCLRRRYTGCSNIPECSIETQLATPRVNINRRCPFSGGCIQCLSRNSAKLQRCEQLYLMITEFANHEREENEFCQGECPSLMIAARDYCGDFNSESTEIMNVCPSYSVMPTKSVELRANHSGQNCLGSTPMSCSDCTWSRSGDLTRCHQLYLLSRFANMSQPYHQTFCTSNCPVKLATSYWYCNRDSTSIFQSCERLDSDTYCGTLIRENGQDDFNRGVTNCVVRGCSSESCSAAKTKYGCCLRRGFRSSTTCPEIPSCVVETASAPPSVSSHLLLLIMAALCSIKF